MSLDAVPISWFDLLAVILLLVGVVRGRKRGMSEELLDVLKWLLIVVAAGFFYEPLGNFLAANSAFSLLSCYVAMYVAIAAIIMAICGFIRRQIGDKLVTSDVFGTGEYYLGMMAGSLRYVCIVLVAIAILNARYFTREEVNAKVQYRMDNYGSDYFPTLNTVQQEVFARSWTGRLATDYLSTILIRPTSPQDKPLGKGGSIVKARERLIEQVLEKK